MAVHFPESPGCGCDLLKLSVPMARYVEGCNRSQSFLLPACVDDYVDENNPVRAVDAFVDALDLVKLGFGRAVPAETRRPAYHPAVMLKLYLCRCLNRIQSSRWLEREAGRCTLKAYDKRAEREAITWGHSNP